MLKTKPQQRSSLWPVALPFSSLTRHRNLRFPKQGRSLELPLFSEEQCVELFGAQLGQEEVARHAAAASAIFKRLGYLPIGVSVAAGLLRDDPALTIDELARNPPADVYALLAKAIVALSAVAQSMLAAMAVCAPEGFRFALAHHVAHLRAQGVRAAG